jgi:hypothetical protein
MTKRGEPLPINGALNRPRTKLGLELSAWMSIVFVTVTVFLAGFKWLAIFSFPRTAIRGMAGGPQAPQDVSTLVFEPQAEELL